MRTFGIRICLLEPAYTRTSFEQNMVLPDRSLDAYVSARMRSSAVMNEIMKTADSPEVVAERVVEAATTYIAPPAIHLRKMARQVSILRRFVPERMLAKAFGQADGIAGVTAAKRISTKHSPLPWGVCGAVVRSGR